MKFNYTRRLMLSVGIYTFILTASIFFIIWLVIEQIELDEEQQLPDQIGQVIDLLLDPATDRTSIDLPEEMKLFLPGTTPLAGYSEFKQPGHYELEDGQHLLVRLHPVTSAPYYLLYSHRSMLDEMVKDRYELGITMLGVICASIAAIFYVTVLVRRLAAPVLLLKEHADNYDGESSEFPLLKRDDEIGALSRSFSELILRMRSFAQRERDFTRFASHELRSPVTVVRGNLDLLAETLPATDANQRILSRTGTAIQRMTLLIDTFLWLGREEVKVSLSPMDATGLLKLIDELLDSYPTPDRERVLTDLGEVHWMVDRFLLSVLLDNLLRNAIHHGLENVLVVANGHSLRVENSVPSEGSFDESGYGLKIVSRLCDVNNWNLIINSDGPCFIVTIDLDGTG